MVETEFLFRFQLRDKHYDIVTKILKIYATLKPFPIYYPVSALIEIREVVASHKKNAIERLNAITFIKAKAISSGLSEMDFLLMK